MTEYYVKNPKRRMQNYNNDSFQFVPENQRLQAEKHESFKEIPPDKDLAEYQAEQQTKARNEIKKHVIKKTADADKKNTYVPSVGRNQELIWNQLKTAEYFDEPLSSIPLETIEEDEQVPEFSFSENLFEKVKSNYQAQELTTKPMTSQLNNKTQNSGPLNEGEFAILFNNEMIFRTKNYETLTHFIESFLQENQSVEFEDLVVLKRLKINNIIVVE